MSDISGTNPNDLSLSPATQKPVEHCEKCHLVFDSKAALMRHFEDHIKAGEVLPVEIQIHDSGLQKEAAPDSSQKIGSSSVANDHNNDNGDNNMTMPAAAASGAVALVKNQQQQPPRVRGEIDLNKEYHEENGSSSDDADASVNLDLTLGH